MRMLAYILRIPSPVIFYSLAPCQYANMRTQCVLAYQWGKLTYLSSAVHMCVLYYVCTHTLSSYLSPLFPHCEKKKKKKTTLRSPGLKVLFI